MSDKILKCSKCNVEPEMKTIHGGLDFYILRCPMCGQFATDYDKGEVLYEWNSRNKPVSVLRKD